MKAHLLTKCIVIASLGLALFSSCVPSDQARYLVVTPVKFTLAPVSNTKTFWVKTSENWYIEQVGHEDWCTVYPDKGTPGDTQITLSVTPLPDNKPRIAIFLIKSTSGIEKTLTVEQNNSGASSYYLEFFGNPDPYFNVDPLMWNRLNCWSTQMLPDGPFLFPKEQKNGYLPKRIKTHCSYPLPMLTGRQAGKGPLRYLQEDPFPLPYHSLRWGSTILVRL